MRKILRNLNFQMNRSSLNYEFVAYASLSLYFLQIFSIHEKSKISDCVFTRVSLEADSVISFSQNSKNSPHVKIHGSPTLSGRLLLP